MPSPVLVVGDVQGDADRLAEALAPFPQDSVRTIFLGDFFQGGRLGDAGGARAARIARDRRNAQTVIGNHELFLLCVLQEVREGWTADPAAAPHVIVHPAVRRAAAASLVPFWLSRRGDWADLRAVSEDPELEAWLRGLPLMLRLDDGTLVQHCDGDTQAELGDDVEAVNARVRELLQTADGTWQVFWHTVQRGVFADEQRLARHLRHFDAVRVVHGHTPHGGDAPEVSAGGRVWCFDGKFSRYWMGDVADGTGPIGATVNLLPPVADDLRR